MKNRFGQLFSTVTKAPDLFPVKLNEQKPNGNMINLANFERSSDPGEEMFTIQQLLRRKVGNQLQPGDLESEI